MVLKDGGIYQNVSKDPIHFKTCHVVSFYKYYLGAGTSDYVAILPPDGKVKICSYGENEYQIATHGSLVYVKKHLVESAIEQGHLRLFEGKIARTEENHEGMVQGYNGEWKWF